MFGFGAEKKSVGRALIFDVGSGSIGVALAGIHSSSPSILWSRREHLPVQENVRLSGLITSTTDIFTALAAAAGKEVLLNFPGTSPDIRVFFSSPWNLTQSLTVKCSEKEPMPSDYYFRQVEKIVDERAHAMQGEKNSAASAVLIERNIVQTKMNGYRTGNLYGKRARGVEATVVLSVIGADIHGRVSAVLDRLFPERSRVFRSFALASFSVVRDLFADAEHFLLVDVGAEVTDVGLVREDALLEAVSFPSGKYAALRLIATALRTSLDDASARVALFMRGRSERGESKRMAAALVDAAAQWQRGFERTLGLLAENSSLPTQVFLTADTDLAEWFRLTLEQSNGGQFTITADPLLATVINREHIKSFLSYAPTAVEDPFLALEALFVHKEARVAMAVRGRP